MLMIQFSFGFLTLLSSFFRSRYNLSLEILSLRQQLGVLKRKNSRPRMRTTDRAFRIMLRRLWLQREAFPESCPYRYALLDRDSKFGKDVTEFLISCGIKPKRIGCRCPWQNGISER